MKLALGSIYSRSGIIAYESPKLRNNYTVVFEKKFAYVLFNIHLSTNLLICTNIRIWRLQFIYCLLRLFNCLFKSSGVSMEKDSCSVNSTAILYPFSSQRSCSSDSAISSEERSS